MGWRKCPACLEKHHFRLDKESEQDQICKNCRRLINEALEARQHAEQANSMQTVIVTLPEVDHWWPGFYDGAPRGTRHEEFRRPLRDALANLYRQIAKPISPTARGRLPWKGKWDGGGYGSPKGEVTIDQYRAMKAVRVSIDLVLQETYRDALAEGRDLLLQIAEGRMTHDELSKRDIERAKRMQDRSGRLQQELDNLDPDDE